MTVVFAILLFSFLIFIHELGHFVTAKLSGVQVNEFALFMGPAIFKKQVGETLYSLRCIPFGGYCAMEGEDNDTDNPRSFQKAKWWKRLIILLAGAFMNLVAGYLLIAIAFAPLEKLDTPVISEAEPGCTIVYDGGMQVGDRILEVDGYTVFTSSDFSMILSVQGGDTHDIVVERDGKKVYLNDFKMETHIFTDEQGNESERYGILLGMEEGNLLNTLKYSLNTSCSVVQSVFLSLKMLVTGQASLSQVSGPVGIVQIMSETADSAGSTLGALLNLLYFGGFIGINLAVMNLLPIPALDGGRAVCLLLTTGYEKITKKKINPKYEGYLHGAGMILLLAFMALILFKDVFQIFTR